MSYTKGPWFVRTIDESIGSVDSENGVMVAQAQQVSSKDQLNGSPERKANARLIAAAPELLEALQAAVTCGMVPSSTAADGGANKHSEWVRVADQIRDAIAKATGVNNGN